MTSVLIVDDHPLVRFAVTMLLERERYEIVGQAEDGSEAVELARKHRPDIVILDIELKKLDGLAVLKRLQAQENAPRVLMLTSKPPALYARRCLDAGASAFVAKGEDLDALSFALKAVVKGYSTFPDLSSHRSLMKTESEVERLARLSDQEMAVLRMLASGMSNNHIGESMHLSPKTVSTYKSRILEKLEVDSLVAMLELCQRNFI